MHDVKTAPGKFKAFGLVRDKDGRPKFDDINNIPEPIWAMLTDEEREEINHGRDTLSSN
jgi:hypothetical protein